MPLNGQFLDKSGLTYLWSKLKTKFATKQDTIADIADIRSGAAAGATAVQPETFETDQQRQETEIGVVANAGAKNLLNVQRPSTTTRTSYTPLASGGVELSCSNAIWTSYAIADIPVEARKEYIITFLLDESSGTSNFSFSLRDGNSSGTNLVTKNYGSTTGNYEALFTPNNSAIWLGIYLNNSATAATATAKLRCMIRPASITDSTFVPYAPTNRELYETKVDTSDLHALLPNITSSTTIKNYVDSLSKGVYTAFIANVSNPSDSPINANCFVNIYVYSASTAAVELIPISSSELTRTYTMRKISGTWRAWYKFEGTVVSAAAPTAT